MAKEERTLLESWKEISAYLKRSERTCRRFEETLGLPVHRLDGTPRAHVFAYADELDDWLQGKLNHAREEAAQRERSRGRKRIILVSFAVAAVVLLGAAALIWSPFAPAPDPVLPRNPSIAVLPFDNPAKDVGLEPWRTALADLIITDLVQSRYVRVVRITDLYRKLIQLKLGEADTFSDADIAAVADKAGADYVTTGSLVREGPNVALTVFVRDPRSKEAARSIKAAYRDEKGIFSAVDGATREIKLALKLTPRQVSRDIDRAVAKISTDSPQAFRLCSQGYRLAGIERFAESIAVLQRAVELDPRFALAYRYLFRACQAAGREEDVEKHIGRAVDLAGRLSERERGEVEYTYYADYDVNEAKKIDALKRMCRLYPQDPFAVRLLMEVYFAQELWDKALALAEGAWPANTSDWIINDALVKCYQNMGWSEKAARAWNEFNSANPGLQSDRSATGRAVNVYMRMNDLDRALAEAERLTALSKPNDPSSLLLKGRVLMLRNDFPAALGEFRKVLELDDPQVQIDGLLQIGDLGLMQGRVEEAKSAYRRGLEIATKLDEKKTSWAFFANEVASLHQEISRLHQLTGQFDEALKEIDEAIGLWTRVRGEADPPSSFLRQKGLILLDMGKMEEFERVISTVRTIIERSKFPKRMRAYYHLLGHRELKRNDLEAAVRHFWKAIDLVSVPGGGQGAEPDYFFSFAEACSRTGRLRQGFEMYQRITLPTVNSFHKGDMYAMSFYRMAKFFDDRTGKDAALESYRSAKAGAISNYRKFLALWGGADPIFAPLVEDARKRLAVLEAQ